MKKIIPCTIAAILLVATAYSQAITSKITSVTNVTCAQDSNGSAAVSANGGSPPYTYLWQPSGQTTDTAIGLFAAIQYTVTITDSAFDTAYNYVTLTATSNLGLSTSSSEVSCFGMADGTAIALPTGGTLPYQYLWQPIATTSSTASNLSAGTYTNTVTDALGCTVTAPASVTQPAVLSATGVAAAGAIYASATGGTLPYTYSWSPPVSTKNIATGLAPGTYTIIVNDSNFCTSSVVVTITASQVGLYFSLGDTMLYCGDTSYFEFDILVSSDSARMFNYAAVDFSFPANECTFTPYDYSVGPDFQYVPSDNDYNQLSVGINHNNVYLTIGNISGTSTNGTIVDSIPKVLFHVKLQIINSCQTDLVSFYDTSLFTEPNFAVEDSTFSHTDSVKTGAYSTYQVQCGDTLGPKYLCNGYCCLFDIYGNCIDSCWDTCSTYPVYCTDTAWVYVKDSVYTFSNYSDVTYGYLYYSGPITVSGCGIHISNSTPGINAGTNASSVSPDPARIPQNSSILTIEGSGFGSQKDSIQVNNANGPGMVTLDSMDILSWSENLIKVKMPGILLKYGLGVPGSGPFTVYNACGDSASKNVQINYNIINDYHIPTNEKTRPDIIMSNDTESLIWRCDTSVSNNPLAYACVKKAIREWNCYTGVNWKLGPPDTMAAIIHYGVSNIYVSSPSYFPPHASMLTNQEFLNLCYNYTDSVSYYNEAQIQINSGITNWSYDTTYTINSSLYNYFYDAILHELGHAHGLNHINDIYSLMYYTQMPHIRDSITSQGAFYPGPGTLLGALDMINTSAANSTAPCPPDSILKPGFRYCVDPTLSTPVISENPYSLNLYPNPTSGQLVTITYQLSKDSHIDFRILDCTGRAVMLLDNTNKTTGNYSEQINVSNLADGVYLFTANIDGECKTIKFIKL